MNKGNQKGITLIALIITIIVILILVAVSVRTISQSGLFDHAKNATNKWADEQQKESELSIDDQIKKYANDGSEIYIALYSNGEGNTLVFDNTPNFEEENLIKVYTDETGKPLNLNEIELYYYWEVASMEKSINEMQQYSICSNWTRTDFQDSNKAKIIPVTIDLELYTNVPWKNEISSIMQVYFNNKIIPKNTASWFAGLRNLTSIVNIRNLDTRYVTDMSYMFYECEKLITLDLRNFDTQNVNNMTAMFYGCNGLTSLDLTNFDTNNVTDMSVMFNGCASLTTLNINKFNTKNVISMEGMFGGCNSLESLDLSNFNTSNVSYMSHMFVGCVKLTTLNLENFNTKNVTNMEMMFYNCKNLTVLNLITFDMNNVTNVVEMFRNCQNLSIYVKDETTKTQIIESSYFPSTCQVIVKESSTTI